MKKTYLIPQVTKQELRLATQICSGEPGGVTNPNQGQGGMGGAPARKLYL